MPSTTKLINPYLPRLLDSMKMPGQRPGFQISDILGLNEGKPEPAPALGACTLSELPAYAPPHHYPHEFLRHHQPWLTLDHHESSGEFGDFCLYFIIDLTPQFGRYFIQFKVFIVPNTKQTKIEYCRAKTLYMIKRKGGGGYLFVTSVPPSTRHVISLKPKQWIDHQQCSLCQLSLVFFRMNRGLLMNYRNLH